jgi:hypothetical protein
VRGSALLGSEPFDPTIRRHEHSVAATTSEDVSTTTSKLLQQVTYPLFYA